VDTVEFAAIGAFFVHIQTQFGIRIHAIFVKHKVFVRPHLIAIRAFGLARPVHKSTKVAMGPERIRNYG
jgi:hypothetical protein